MCRKSTNAGRSSTNRVDRDLWARADDAPRMIATDSPGPATLWSATGRPRRTDLGRPQLTLLRNRQTSAGTTRVAAASMPGPGEERPSVPGPPLDRAADRVAQEGGERDRTDHHTDHHQDATAGRGHGGPH